MHTNHAVLAARTFLKHAVEHGRAQRPPVDRLEVFGRRQVHQQRRVVCLAAPVEPLRRPRAPEPIERDACVGGQRRTHFEPVRLHRIERLQHAVQAAQDRDVLLRPDQRVGWKRARIERPIHRAVVGEHGGARVGGRMAGRPRRVARGVARGHRIAQAHRCGQLRRRQRPQPRHQRSGLRTELQPPGGKFMRGQRRLEVERLGGRQQQQHCARWYKGRLGA